jgi:hypothetical protein
VGERTGHYHLWRIISIDLSSYSYIYSISHRPGMVSPCGLAPRCRSSNAPFSIEPGLYLTTTFVSYSLCVPSSLGVDGSDNACKLAVPPLRVSADLRHRPTSHWHHPWPSPIKGHLEILTPPILRFDTPRSDSCNLTARYHSTTTGQAEPLGRL